MAAGSTSLCTRATCSAPAVGKARQRRKSSQSNFPAKNHRCMLTSIFWKDERNLSNIGTLGRSRRPLRN